MKKSTGYKEMLRDRCPKVVDFALKWCQAKERWIDHAYINFVKVFSGKEERKQTARIILGIAKCKKVKTGKYTSIMTPKREFVFDESIDWDNLTHEEEAYWKWVSGWVRWFMKNFAYIENTYNISRSIGKSEFDCKVEIIQKFLQSELSDNVDDKESLDYVDRLVDYLVKCVESINKK